MNKLKDTIYPWMKWANKMKKWFAIDIYANFFKVFIRCLVVIPFIVVVLPLLILMNRVDYTIDKWMDFCDNIMDRDPDNTIMLVLQIFVVLILFVGLTVGPLSLTYLAPRIIMDWREEKRDREIREANRLQMDRPSVTLFYDTMVAMRHGRFKDELIDSKIKKHKL